ncbi:MAG: hypothetical protein RLN88_09550 [Ekhidna sp.]|uniref:uridine kinase family protein n=1 Tax=Ekhidna sp. TaxID=2608089 RepID=UPI0032EE9DB8
MAHIIGIGGASRSGKSTLARKLKEALAPKQVLLLDMDNYVFPENEVPHIQGHPDWEVPESIDYEWVIATIDDNEPDYDFIIVEGILAFANETLRARYDLTVFMEISKATYVKRRKLETRWGKDPEWYIEYVWEAHLKYGQYGSADFVLSGETPIQDADLKRILRKIHTLGK